MNATEPKAPTEATPTETRPLAPTLADLEAQARELDRRAKTACAAEIDAVLARFGFVAVPRILIGPSGVLASEVVLERRKA